MKTHILIPINGVERVIRKSDIKELFKSTDGSCSMKVEGWQGIHDLKPFDYLRILEQLAVDTIPRGKNPPKYEDT